MRYSWLIGAVCAAGALAKPVDKRSYVTEWTIVTVTKTIYLPYQPAPTSTSTSTPACSPIQKVQTVASDASAPAPVLLETEASSAAPIPTPSSAPIVDELPGAPAWSSAWTSSAPEAAQPTTLDTSTSTTAPAASATNAYQSAVLYNHNIHRSNHSANSLTWNTTLESSAYKLAAECVFHHDTDIDGGGYGQNIGIGVSADEVGKMITNEMYNGEFHDFDGLYGMDNPPNFDKWGHFSQIVWNSTVSVGCATVFCNVLLDEDKKTTLSPAPFMVCNYYPPGNYEGEYGKHVSQPLGHPSYWA
ncbi:hypothetical protein Aspvir_008592 [Aspergillus viridinutans]|uniref:SCP domain-containing protein n=1 Tax=Aspergillus viridinutans TaxID=75553 RepID=A0A9P3C609_ASPVI|nr:uncharacterized protein Aspvir_008592 [Aspergillus viridinutans]GIK04509.1 hypothetical protein Aspvir_008592 [Aspergillus viridinutans]